MINFLYRTFLVKMSHNTKMKIAGFFYKLPVFHGILEKTYDFHPLEPAYVYDVESEKSKFIELLKNKVNIEKSEGEKNFLENFFLNSPHRLVSKHWRYFDVYDTWFSKFRDKKVTIVEIGIFKGGSLQMWKHYFGKNARIIGIDIDPECKNYEEDQIEVFIGNQEDRKFWKEFKEKVSEVDILIDDGGHTMNQQIVTFDEMYDCISPEGIYICEDCSTSYWPSMGGGYKVKSSFIEFSKNFVDVIHARYSKTKKLSPDKYTDSLYGLHFYDQMVVFEKKQIAKIPNETVTISN